LDSSRAKGPTEKTRAPREDVEGETSTKEGRNPEEGGHEKKEKAPGHAGKGLKEAPSKFERRENLKSAKKKTKKN